jgi:predicted ATP-dependent endonuclease of OLD family
MPNRIITSIQVENFRSLNDSGTIELDSSNALFGLNSSGKSNILRALNWFFNDIVEEGIPISLSSDINYSKKKKKREIKIKVEFDPSAVHTFPKSLRKKWHPTKPFSIIKSVYYKNNLQETKYHLKRETNPKLPKDFESSAWAISFMSLFKFRYIQAYRNPANLIKDLMVEAQRYLEPSIKQRLTFSKNRATKAMGTSAKNTDIFEQMQTSVQQAASKVFGDLEDKVKKTLSNVSKLQAGLPENWLTWIKDLGFRFTTLSGGIVDEQAQGAGAQSYLFLLLLCFIAKRTRSYGFGWRQGEIWGIEEPEIYMHYSLAEECARLLRDVSDSQEEDEAPIQLLITTHSYPFIAAMKKKVPIQINSSGYTVFSSDQGIGVGPVIAGVLPYTHPLFADAGKRLVLVEGTHDKLVFEKYLQHTKSETNVKIVRISDLTHAPSGNNSDRQMVDYIKKNFGPLAS